MRSIAARLRRSCARLARGRSPGPRKPNTSAGRVKIEPGGTLRLKNFSGRVTITAARPHRRGHRRGPPRHARPAGPHQARHPHRAAPTVVVDANHRDRSWFDWAARQRGRHRLRHPGAAPHQPRRVGLQQPRSTSPASKDRSASTAFPPGCTLDDVVGLDRRAHLQRSGRDSRRERGQPGQTIDVDTFSGSIALHVPDTARGAGDLPLLQRPPDVGNAADAATPGAAAR